MRNGNRIARWSPGVAAVVAIAILLPATAGAILIDFEDGRDGWTIRSTIPGFEFTTTNRHDWVYGDWRTGDYNGPYPNGPNPSDDAFYSNGNFFAWLDTTGDEGIVTFTASHATYLSIGYSSDSVFFLEAYDDLGNLLDSDSGVANLRTGTMTFLTVEADGMRYVVMHDSGNHWLVDDLTTDAVTECLQDSECDDGLFCNGQERCLDYICTEGDAVACPDDGVFCNGAEYCDETEGCLSEGNPCVDDGLFCNGEEYCDNVANACASSGNPCIDECDENLDECPEGEIEDDDDEAEEDDPEVTSAGGCGGCSIY